MLNIGNNPQMLFHFIMYEVESHNQTLSSPIQPASLDMASLVAQLAPGSSLSSFLPRPYGIYRALSI